VEGIENCRFRPAGSSGRICAIVSAAETTILKYPPRIAGLPACFSQTLILSKPRPKFACYITGLLS